MMGRGAFSLEKIPYTDTIILIYNHINVHSPRLACDGLINAINAQIRRGRGAMS